MGDQIGGGAANAPPPPPDNGAVDDDLMGMMEGAAGQLRSAADEAEQAAAAKLAAEADRRAAEGRMIQDVDAAHARVDLMALEEEALRQSIETERKQFEAQAEAAREEVTAAHRSRTQAVARFKDEELARRKAQDEAVRARSQHAAEQDARIEAERLLANERRASDEKQTKLESERAAAEQDARNKAAALDSLRKRKLARIALWLIVLAALVAWILRPPAALDRYSVVGVKYLSADRIFVVLLRQDANGQPMPTSVRLFCEMTPGATSVGVKTSSHHGKVIRVQFTAPPGHDVLADKYLFHVEQESGEAE